MHDPYELALKRLRSDRRSLNELEREIGIPAETLRDIKRRIVKFPRFDTLKRLVAYYEQAA
jgi:DNA-binding Xre family transcriptional regulator